MSNQATPQGPQGPQGPRGGSGPAKPGAMTMAMRAVQLGVQAGPKVLRIGRIEGGRIVEERLIRRRETVTVGRNERCHFILQGDDVPSRFELFQLVGNDYILNFTDRMKGRVGLAGGVQDLDQLRATGGARNAGTHWQVKLGDNSRGKVVIGPTTLLFQFVTPPPVQPRPQLPAAVRGGFVRGIDWLFTTFVVLSYMFFFGFVVYLESADWPLAQGIAAIPDEYREFIYQEPEPPPAPTDQSEATDEAAEEAPQQEEARSEAPSRGESRDRQPSTGEDPAVSAEARARIAQEAASQAEALILGAIGESGEIANVLAGGAVTGNAADVLALSQGVGVATSAGGALRTRGGGGGSGEQGGLGLLRAAGGGAGQAVGEGERIVERVIRGRVDFESGDEVGGTGVFDQNLVTQMIRSRRSAFQRCYETSLRNNPTLAGKVTVEFTIQPSGGVTGARAVENTTGDGALASCIVGVIGRLRWTTGPEDGSVTFSYPFVFAPQN